MNALPPIRLLPHSPLPSASTCSGGSLAKSTLMAIVLCALWVVPGVAQPPAHFTDCLTRTGSNATVIVPASASIAMDHNEIAAGDELAVFTPAGHCVGTATWTGINIALTVWGGNDFASDDEPLEAGQPMIFRAWDASTGEEFGGETAFTVSFSDQQPYFVTENRFVPDGIYVVDSLRLNPSPHVSR